MHLYVLLAELVQNDKLCMHSLCPHVEPNPSIHPSTPTYTFIWDNRLEVTSTESIGCPNV